MLMKSNLEISEGGGWFASGDGVALCYKQRRRGCSLPKKAMVTPSQITKPSRETVMEMSSEKMRWKAIFASLEALYITATSASEELMVDTMATVGRNVTRGLLDGQHCRNSPAQIAIENTHADEFAGNSHGYSAFHGDWKTKIE
ncbi:hypothetical protein QYF36_001329 [Acer negundo]|nr:hypothetical protein QYF36_001329 [Acer negundo]